MKRINTTEKIASLHAISMAITIVVYIISFKEISITTDEMVLPKTMKAIHKKMFFLFFSIGVCWLALFFSVIFPDNIGFSWLFTIFKVLQVIVLTYIVMGSRLIKFSPKRFRLYKIKDVSGESINGSNLSLPQRKTDGPCLENLNRSSL